MKKTFRVELTETVRYYTEIEAETIEEALAEGKRLADGSDFPNGICDLLASKVTAIEEEDEKPIKSMSAEW